MNSLISVFLLLGQGTVGAAGLIIYHIINPASFALQTLAAPITRKFLGCRGIFSKIPRIFLTDKLKFERKKLQKLENKLLQFFMLFLILCS